MAYCHSKKKKKFLPELVGKYIFLFLVDSQNEQCILDEKTHTITTAITLETVKKVHRENETHVCLNVQLTVYDSFIHFFFLSNTPWL